MKQTVVDILIYLFENYIDEEIELDLDSERLQDELHDAGFDSIQVSKAFDWLHGLASTRELPIDDIAQNAHSTRIFSTEEIDKLDLECRGFIYFLEQIGVLDPANRELVIERVLALESDEIDTEQLKWIVLMVLFNQPGHEQAFVWMEDLVMDDMYGGNLH